MLVSAHAGQIPLPDESVQCIVTSPPYWGLRKYAGEQELIWGGGERAAYGLEPTIEMYVDHTVQILRECRRVLRKDGVLFWNVGDSYAASKGYSGDLKPSDLQSSNRGSLRGDNTRPPNRNGQSGLKPKDLCLIPARVALAAQADVSVRNGRKEAWWVRSMIVWAKPNPMPESVTDRPTDACEHVIMLTKSERYFWDADAVREPSTGNTHSRGNGNGGPKARDRADEGTYEGWADGTRKILASRNMRNVWTFPTQPYSGAHFATFPEEIPRRCILAGTSAKGACVQCGAPWKRVVRASGGTIGSSWVPHTADLAEGMGQADGGDIRRASATYRREELGWTPTCRCRGQHGRTRPCLVLDPFGGSGTTGRVATELNRRAVCLDIAYGRTVPEDAAKGRDYARLADRRTRGVQRKLLV